MATQFTIPETIELGDVSGPLSALYTSKKALFGGSVIRPVPPIQIAIITDILRWGYDGGAQATATLRQIGNYAYWMYGKFGLEAQYIINGQGGGTVVPTPSGRGGVPALDFEVSASSIIPTGGTTLLINGTNGLPDYRGYLIVNFIRNGIGQNTTSLGDGSSYYAWNSVTGLFSCFPALDLRDLVRIFPDATGGTSSGTSANTPDTIILGADGTYTLASGYQIWKITINPSVADTVRIGTAANGDEIMMDKVMTINTYANNGVTADVFAEGSDQTIYFTGFTGAATINIYTLPI